MANKLKSHNFFGAEKLTYNKQTMEIFFLRMKAQLEHKLSNK